MRCDEVMCLCVRNVSMFSSCQIWPARYAPRVSQCQDGFFVVVVVDVSAVLFYSLIPFYLDFARSG